MYARDSWKITLYVLLAYGFVENIFTLKLKYNSRSSNYLELNIAI